MSAPICGIHFFRQFSESGQALAAANFVIDSGAPGELPGISFESLLTGW